MSKFYEINEYINIAQLRKPCKKKLFDFSPTSKREKKKVPLNFFICSKKSLILSLILFHLFQKFPQTNIVNYKSICYNFRGEEKRKDEKMKREEIIDALYFVVRR